MRAWFPRLLVLALGIALAVSLLDRAPAQIPAPREQGSREQPPRLPPDVQAAGLLHHAYDSLSLVRIWMSSDRVKLPQDEAKLADQADEFYRNASKAYKSGDYQRATALAAASVGAARGLMSALHADTRPLANVPVPPEAPTPPANAAQSRSAAPAGQPEAIRGPRDAARNILRDAREQIIAADKATTNKGPARAFVDASRTSYEQGRQAYEKGDYSKAMDLASAAQAWARVSDDLRQAEGGTRPGTGGSGPRP